MPNRAYRNIYRELNTAKSPTPQIGKNLDFGPRMAVWPDPTHGKCSYGYSKVLICVLKKLTFFENLIFYTFLDYVPGSGLMKMFLWAVGSFHVFGEKKRIRLRFSSQSPVF